nr:MAG TPA: hypothetical protein [Caudoviricetes sp.]
MALLSRLLYQQYNLCKLIISFPSLVFSIPREALAFYKLFVFICLSGYGFHRIPIYAHAL